MVPLVRGPTPDILREKAAAWTAKFLAARQSEPNKRPDHRCYGHDQVRVELRRMSHHKCFYCERKLTEREQEVDHYVEVAERPEDAFAWENLCLSCKPCNSDKAPNRTHPVSACLDPCRPGVSTEDHLLFEGENIGVRNHSSMGKATISKYQLDRDDLNLARSRALRQLSRASNDIRRLAEAEGRKVSNQEREIIRAFAEPNRPFSLMMQAELALLGW